MALFHGFGGDYNSEFSVAMKKSLLNQRNCIMLVSTYSGLNQPYQELVANGDKIALIFTKLILVFLKNFGRTHCDLMGHSFGAHMAGMVGRNLQASGMTPDSIVGFDAARPEFEKAENADKRLSCGDAANVLIIHTDNVLGMEAPAGWPGCDLYVHGGHDQPNCTNKMSLMKNGCNHFSGFRKYCDMVAENKSYPAQTCPTAQDAQDTKRAASACKNQGVLYSPDPAARYPKGIFYVAPPN